MILIELLHNVAILVALCAFSGFIPAKYTQRKFTGQVLQGLFFGIVVIIGMINPLILNKGVLIDGRVIVISLATFLFGPTTGLISSIIGIISRIIYGSVGVITGVLLIIMAYGTGLIYYTLRMRGKIKVRKLTFYSIGGINSIAMLMLMGTLPAELAKDTFQNIALTVILFFPLITLIIGKILSDQMENVNYIDIIKEERNLFQTTILSIGDAIITTDIQGKITSINPIAVKLTGYTESDAIGQSVSEVLRLENEITGNKVECPVDVALKENRIVELANHTYLISRNGERIPIADSAAPIKNSKAEIKGVVLVFRDQSQERKRQKELSESEARFRSIVEGAPEPIFICIDNKFVYLNPPALKLFEADNASELIGKPINERFISILQTKSSNGNGSILEEDFRNKLIETIIISLKGNQFWVEITGEPTNYKSQKGMVVFIRDISQRKTADEQLKHLHRLMQYIIEHNRSAVAVHDRDLRYIYVSKRYLQEYNVKEEEIIGKHHYEVFPDLPEEWRKVHQKALQGIISSAEDDPYVRADGSIEWTRWECRPWYESDASIGGIIIYTEVITERKKAEEAVRQSEKMLSSIFRVAPVGIGVVVNRIFVDVNPEVCKITGYTREEMIGKKSRMVYATQEEFEYVGREKYRMIAKSGTGIVETKWKTRSGEIRIILLGSTPIDTNDLEKGVTFTALDITENKKQELKLKESEEKFRRLFENHSAVKLITDPNTGNIIDANDKAAEYYGWSKDELKSMRIQDINTLPEVMVKKEMAKVRAKLQNYFEFRHRLKNGTVRDVEVFSSKIEIAGKDFLHSIVHDVTEKKKTEKELQNYREQLEMLVKQRTEELDKLNNNLLEQLEKEKELEEQLKNSLSKEKELNELKNKFIATVSHEFRTPLAALLSSAQSIQRYSAKWSEVKINEHYSRIGSTVKYLTQLLDDVLTISRSDREVLMNNPGPVKLHEILKDYNEEVRPLLKRTHILLIINECEKEEIIIDKKLLHQIIINLITNAIKYSPNGGKIEVKLGNDNENMVIDVSDQGIGIPENESKLIFEPFYRSSNSVGVQGTGLGLNIVKRCLEILKGEISFESTINLGTTFRIKIPVQIPNYAEGEINKIFK